MTGLHPSHKTRSSDASTFDEICIFCGATDKTGGGWGRLSEPCPANPMTEQTADHALVEELARVIYPYAFHCGDTRWQDRVSAILKARALLPFITIRDRETWNRAIEAAAKVCIARADKWTECVVRYRAAGNNGPYLGDQGGARDCASAIARLKDQTP